LTTDLHLGTIPFVSEQFRFSEDARRMECVDFPNVVASVRCAEYAVDLLGRKLAGYLLTPEKRRRLGLSDPFIPNRRGSAVALLVWNPETVALPDGSPFAPAFGLPLEWREGRADSPRLPASLREVASRVLETIGADGWGLWPASELGDESLVQLTVDARSCSVPLMGALYIAKLGGQPAPRVFATGEWSSKGVVRVGGIAEKVEAVASLAAEGQAPLLFVPAENRKEAEAVAGDRVRIEAFPPTEPKSVHWEAAMRSYLGKLDAPPPKLPDNYEQRVEYVNRPHVAASEGRQRLYLELVADDIADRLRPVGSWSRGVFVVSQSPDLVGLMLRVFRPKDGLLLASKETEKHIEKVRRDQPGIRFDMASLDLPPERLATTVAEWLKQEPDPEKRMADVTAGPRLASFAILAAVLRVGGSAWCLQSRWIEDVRGAVKAGEESLLRVDPMFREEGLEQLPGPREARPPTVARTETRTQ
jgi:hypothetical protein